jgi:hypothetical protein
MFFDVALAAGLGLLTGPLTAIAVISIMRVRRSHRLKSWAHEITFPSMPMPPDCEHPR